MTKQVKNITPPLVLLIWAVLSLAYPLATFADQHEPLIVLHVPRQIANNVLRNGIETKARVGAKISIDPDGTASGRLLWRTREDGRVIIKAMTGRGIFDANGELTSLRLVFMEANGDPVIATVRPAAGEIDDCVLWDLMDGLGGEILNNFPETASFDVRGRIGVRHRR